MAYSTWVVAGLSDTMRCGVRGTATVSPKSSTSVLRRVSGARSHAASVHRHASSSLAPRGAAKRGTIGTDSTTGTPHVERVPDPDAAGRERGRVSSQPSPEDL